MRVGKDRNGNRVYHLLTSECRSHKHVVRSTFAAELRAATAAADDLICMALTLHELKAPHGPGRAGIGRKLLDEGGLMITTVLCIDGLSVWQSICGAVPKAPAEKTLHVHLRWMRELLDRGVLRFLKWIDTRDMSADGHTKGSITRDDILRLMRGHYEAKHDVSATLPGRLGLMARLTPDWVRPLARHQRLPSTALNRGRMETIRTRMPPR